VKIAHVVGTFPPHFGGMGSVAFEEAKRLGDLGHEVTVFTMQYPEFVYQKYDWPFRVVRIKPVVKLGDAGLVPQLLKEIKGFDLVHLHYPFFGGAEMIWFSKLFNHEKYVVTYHMDAKPDTFLKKVIQVKYNFFYSRAIFKNAEKIMVVDENFYESSYLKNQISKPVEVLWNGVDERVFRPLPHVKEASKYNKTLLFVGNLLMVKRLDLLIQVLKGLPPEYVLVVIGDGYAAGDYKKQVELLELEDRVRFVGAVRDKETLNDYYNSADCTIIPSGDTESFSLVALESLSAGTPVIASDLPGTRGRIVIGQDGLLFRPLDVKDLKEKIEGYFLMSVEDRKKMGEAGRKKILENYTWDRHIEKLLEIYRSVL